MPVTSKINQKNNKIPSSGWGGLKKENNIPNEKLHYFGLKNKM